MNLMRATYDDDSYHCAHYALDVWHELAGQDLRERFEPLLCGQHSRRMPSQLLREFDEIPTPVSPCFALMGTGVRPHLGVYWRGQVLHLQGTGPCAVRLPQLRALYSSVRFFTCSTT